MLAAVNRSGRIAKFPSFNANYRQRFLLPALRQSARLFSFALSNSSRSTTVSPGRNGDEPLRILYCGSDDFSCASLQSLHREYMRPSSNIASIDVLCRAGKRYGRGLKLIRDPKIKDVAKDMGLPVHQIETFTGWQLPEYKNECLSKINLVVAVSFGLLIPQRILKEAKFSGMNLHPSMLPEYRGAAPLHWTILNGEKTTGITLQTLHPTSFDRGTILDQTPQPGIEIPQDCDYDGLLHIMQNVGAEMLVNTIRRRLYLSSHSLVDSSQGPRSDDVTLKTAPKITTMDRQLRFNIAGSARILRMSRAFDSTWALAVVPNSTCNFKKQRLIFQGPLKLNTECTENKRVTEIPPGLPYWSLHATWNGDIIKQPLLINTIDGQTISVESLKMEGDVKSSAYKVAVKHRLIGQPHMVGSKRVMTFHDVLNTEAWL